VSGANFNITDKQAERYDTVRVIRKESDFPAPILAPDGLMRIPLAISVDYVFDVDQIDITTPFLMPSRLFGFERVRFQSHTNTTMNYAGTGALFFGRNQGPFETDKVDYVGISGNEKCFDMIAADGTIPLTIFNTGFVNIDMGLVDGFAITGFRVGFFDLLGPLRIDNIIRCFINILILSTPNPPADFPIAAIITGGIPVAGIGFNNVIAGPITGAQSYFALDSGAVFNQVSFRDIPFDGSGGTFFEPDLTGSISEFQDIVSLISGSVLLYSEYTGDANGNVLVTTPGDHGTYHGLTVNHFSTINYDGQHKVLLDLGKKQYVMDAIYQDDELSGFYTGIGTRVTTTTAPNITTHRTVEITGTTNYDAAVLEVLNTILLAWDITSAAYNGNSFFVGGQDMNGQGIIFKSDGLKMFILGIEFTNVYEYDLSVRWDVTSAVYNGNSFFVGGQETLPIDISFKSDGLKMFILGIATDTVYEYDLSIPWDVTSAVYNGNSFSISGQDITPTGISFKSDGLKMFILGKDNDTVYEYDLSIPWDVTSAVYNGNSFFVGGQDTNGEDIIFKSDGLKMLILGNDNDTVYEYDLSIPWDITSAAYNGNSFFVGGQDMNSTGISFKSNGLKMFILGRDNNNVYEYDLGTAFDIATPFAGDDATGNYKVVSLDQTDTKVLANNNGVLPDSKKVGEVDLDVVLTVTGSGTAFTQIGGANWTPATLEEFTATNAGVLTYIGQNPATFVVIGTATIEKTSGGSATLAMRIAKEGITIPSSQGATQNGTPTQVTCLAIVTLAPNESVSLFVNNIDTGDEVIVNSATLLASGM